MKHLPENSDMFCCVCGGSDKDERNQLLQCNRFLLKVITAAGTLLLIFICFTFCAEYNARDCRACNLEVYHAGFHIFTKWKSLGFLQL